MNRLCVLVIGLLVFSGRCCSYEIDTHAWLTKRVFDRSVLAPGSAQSAALYATLGWERLPQTKPFNLPVGISISGGEVNSYYDLRPTWQVGQALDFARSVADFERRRMPFEYRSADPTLGDRPWLRFEAWIMRGAIREDDLAQSEYTDGSAPDVDPHGEITRVLRHFYNPVNDDALLQFARATDWSLGVADALAAPPVISNSRGNHFSWADARRAYFQALAFKSVNPQTVDPLVPKDDFSRRHLFWGTTLDSLGHVLHLLQDAAQPQHSRVDYHNHSESFPSNQFNKKPRRRTYELITNLRILNATTGSDLPFVPQSDQGKFVTLLGQPLNRGIGDPMPTTNYPIPRFTSPVEYFTTKVSDFVQTARRGLADYSNRGFFSEGTLFNSTQMPLPPSGIAAPGNAVVETVVPTTIGNVRAREVRRAVPDALAPGFVDADLVPIGGLAPLYSISLWDQFGQSFGDGPGRIITLQQYRIHADMLAPRAIAYGAGLIDYFFRGRLELTPTKQKAFAVLNQGEAHSMGEGGRSRVAPRQRAAA